MRTVAVFDAEFPPGVAFIRSLGRAGVDVTVCTPDRFAPGRYSRHTTAVRWCPPVLRTDEFIGWLAEEFTRGSVDLVAPTSDYVSFCVTEALEKIGGDGPDAGQPHASRLRTCLFKHRFARAIFDVGFPTPPTAAPGSLDEAFVAAAEIGYPVVLKPRTHVGVGFHRGVVARTTEELSAGFVPYRLDEQQSAVRRHDPDLALPIVQRYHELDTVDVVSVTGCLHHDGELLALGHCRKVSQTPRRLGVGTMFESLPSQPFTDAAVDAVRRIQGSGVFELEVLVDRATGDFWAVDLNPRGFGQISFDIALGNDLPALWYRSVTGMSVGTSGAHRHPPQYWHEAVSSYVGFAVHFVTGPHRAAAVRHGWHRIASPSVGAMFDGADPVPGVLYGFRRFRHPRALVRSFAVDVEIAGTMAATDRWVAS